MFAESEAGTRVHYNPVMLLAGDLGGTKTLLGLFERGDRRPRVVASHAYQTHEFTSFAAILDAFARDLGRTSTIEAAAIGVAGPVVDQMARLTNVDWDVSAAEIARRLGTRRVALLNDLEAMAQGIPVLNDAELVVLQRGAAKPEGHAVVIAAGTGLGQAYLRRIDGRLVPVPSEGGHADFAARTDREIDFLRMLRARFGRAEVEQVLSGPGLVNLHRFTHAGHACEAVLGRAPHEIPAAISAAAIDGRCPACGEALSMFVEAYGSEAGNLALRGVATGGVFIGGGIAPKILPALQDGRFMAAFHAKGPMTDLLSAVPVQVIVNPDAGLLGAAVAAQELI
jgi:glucokinase